jgi:deoxyribose-phosphate aldolase
MQLTEVDGAAESGNSAGFRGGAGFPLQGTRQRGFQGRQLRCPAPAFAGIVAPGNEVNMAMDPRQVTEIARRALAALDLTSLGEDDSPERIETLCASVAGPGGLPAAVCVYPEHIGTARRALARAGAAGVRVATVVNFPDGSADAGRAARETRRAVAAGADEVDMVLPWQAVLAGDPATAARLVSVCRQAAPGRVLKVILETGGLGEAGAIRRASELALGAGADFIKTSTGKVPVGATPEAARIMLEAIRAHGGQAGFKASGGVRTLADAACYLGLADDILGAGWATPAHFRIGASGLLGEIRAALGGVAPSAPAKSH